MRRLWSHHALLVPLLLAVTGALALTSMLGDSMTFDEPQHLTAGMNILANGDYAMSIEHPPLAKVWAACPLLLTDQRWPDDMHPSWRDVDEYAPMRAWLVELNDGEQLLRISRCLMLAFWLGACLSVYALGRRLFGPPAGLVALVLAGFSPTLLAHGRLVTTDVPITFCSAVALLALARLLEVVTWRRVLVAGIAWAATCVTKFSWVLLLPALGIMLLAVVARARPLVHALPARRRSEGAARSFLRRLDSRPRRALLLSGVAGIVALVMWLGIWTAYGWRGPAAGAQDSGTAGVRVSRLDHYWQAAQFDADGRPHPGFAAAAFRAVAATHFLPDAYLLGFARMAKIAGQRPAYLCGEYSDSGWWYYFPVAFVLKTPLATLLLALAGLVAIVTARARVRDPVLLAGLVVFVLVYGASALLGHLNIGERHLLPTYPLLFCLGGAAATWATHRAGRVLVCGALLWLVVANARIYPHYLAYFNELAGGPQNGARFLADSNIDWGQDLYRLAGYATRHPAEHIKLAYFGTADPRRYGFACEALPSYGPWGAVGELTAGTYVVSVNQWLGLVDPLARDATWADESMPRRYTQLHAHFTDRYRVYNPRFGNDARQMFDRLRWSRLLYSLRRRAPDERVGYSLLVYRLSPADLETLTRP
jgi:hypothetical protein